MRTFYTNNKFPNVNKTNNIFPNVNKQKPHKFGKIRQQNRSNSMIGDKLCDFVVNFLYSMTFSFSHFCANPAINETSLPVSLQSLRD